ncbi:hypothetical protein DFH09DRAFT_828701, partial [Mycena vulgaris]
GPKNSSRDHFHDPVPVKINGDSRWEFKCKHCPKSCTFPRTVKRDASFEDEPKQPALGNLATHLHRHGGPTIPIPGASPVGDTRGVTPASAKIMEEFLREGKLNPAIKPTQKGFLTVFAAWILEDDLPFTTGETGGIQRLFKYMQSKFLLPSDTTAIDQWVFEQDEFRPLLLDDDHWNLLEALGEILKVRFIFFSFFTQVTLQMSKSTTPTLPWVLPMYEKMLKHLKSTRDNVKILPSLRAAVTAGLEKLNEYYEKARNCQFNVIAT